MFFHAGEEKAWFYLRENGHRLLSHNFRTPDRRTEIDLITLKDSVVHFIEVKEWRSGNPLMTQNRKRIAMVRRAAEIFLSSDDFRNSIMSYLEHARDGHDSVVEKVRRTDHASMRPNEALCPETGPFSRLEEAYSVSFDMMIIKSGRVEYLERIF